MARYPSDDPQFEDPAYGWPADTRAQAEGGAPINSWDARTAQYLNMYAPPGYSGPGYLRDAEMGRGMNYGITDPQDLIKWLLLQNRLNR